MSESTWCGRSKPPAVLVGAAMLFGCAGEETIPLKDVESVREVPKEAVEADARAFKGASAGMKPAQRPGRGGASPDE